MAASGSQADKDSVASSQTLLVMSSGALSTPPAAASHLPPARASHFGAAKPARTTLMPSITCQEYLKTNHEKIALGHVCQSVSLSRATALGLLPPGAAGQGETCAGALPRGAGRRGRGRPGRKGGRALRRCAARRGWQRCTAAGRGGWLWRAAARRRRARPPWPLRGAVGAPWRWFRV